MIFNIGNGPVRKLPVLDETYPQDLSINAGKRVTLEVVIAEEGKPGEYTYQWYYDDSPVAGATEAAYTRQAEFGEHTAYCLVTNKAGVVTSRTATVTANKQYLFYYGDQKEDVTGGWIGESRPISSDASSYWANMKVTTKANGGVNLVPDKYGGCVYRAKNPIDLTDVKTIKLTGSIYGNHGSSAWAGLFVWSSIGSYFTSNVVASAVSKQSTLSNPSINVSSLTGTYYIGFGLFRTDSNASMDALSLNV